MDGQLRGAPNKIHYEDVVLADPKAGDSILVVAGKHQVSDSREGARNVVCKLGQASLLISLFILPPPISLPISLSMIHQGFQGTIKKILGVDVFVHENPRNYRSQYLVWKFNESG